MGWVRHLVSRGTSSEVAPPPWASLPGAWDHVLAAVRVGHITGTLADLAADASDSLGPALRREAVQAHQAAMSVALRLERSLLGVHSAFVAADIDHIVLKGPAVAHLDHADPAQRDFGDVDVLVRSSEVDAAVEVLIATGHVRLLPAAHPRLDRVFAKSVTFRGPDSLEVDLHRTLCPGSFGLSIPLDRLWHDTDEFEVGGQVLRALAPRLRMVHTAVHLHLGSSEPHLSTRRDLLVQADLHPVSAVAEAAERLGLAAVLQGAIVQAGDAGTPLPPPYRRWADAYVAVAGDTDRLARHRDARDDFGRRTRPVLRELPWRDRAIVLRALALPPRAHLAARGLGRGQHLRLLWSRRRA